jgi:hypothetical protein
MPRFFPVFLGFCGADMPLLLMLSAQCDAASRQKNPRAIGSPSQNGTGPRPALGQIFMFSKKSTPNSLISDWWNLFLDLAGSLQ